jgi:hypothetical protein
MKTRQALVTRYCGLIGSEVARFFSGAEYKIAGIGSNHRRAVIDGCRPFLSPHFNLTIELPLKAIVRGYSWTVMPITWRTGVSANPSSKSRKWGAHTCSLRSIAGWNSIQPWRL